MELRELYMMRTHLEEMKESLDTYLSQKESLVDEEVHSDSDTETKGYETLQVNSNERGSEKKRICSKDKGLWNSLKREIKNILSEEYEEEYLSIRTLRDYGRLTAFNYILSKMEDMESDGQYEDYLEEDGTC